jgi:phosphopantothenoylcysteine decarboxylase/phosphopantothenate--cysteine ligase
LTRLAGARILLGISASIAAYKAPELVRMLRREGADVRVVLTPGAGSFVTPLTLQALSGHPVRSELLDPAAEAGMDHITLARWAHLVLVAPASADLLARLSLGLADDLLATLCLASEAPLVLAPAMNRVMWEAEPTREHVARLTRRGAQVVGPGSGDQACGEVGAGRMAEPAEIAAAVAGLLAPRAPTLAGRHLLVTAGPTREALDPVRYLGNRSSGRMGFAVAAAAARAGAAVTLVTGPVALESPPGVTRVDVVSAADMLQAVLERVGDADILVAAAAVADYRPARYSPHKIKKGGPRVVELERTEDILATVARRRPRPFLVGFAAETEALEDNARAKLEGKSLDLIAANRVGAEGPGIESDDNALTVLWPGGARTLERAPKALLAERLVALIAERYAAAPPPGGADGKDAHAHESPDQDPG